ncbi:MAG: ROK family protein [Rhizomicrobium sp.]
MRLGIDLGGTKTEIIALDRDGHELIRRRVPTPKDSYGNVISTMRDLVTGVEGELNTRGTVGVAIPGTISPVTGLVKNSNATRSIGHPLDKDLGAALGREVRVVNDANCFTLSEATDGAAAGRDIVFGIIAGTGVGGGVCVGGRVLTGAHAIAGEWGHNPLPRPSVDEVQDAPRCYCGRSGCIEAWCSGPAFEARFKERTGKSLKADEIAAVAVRGDIDAKVAIEQFLDRFARAISTLVNILDPDAIVIGGGLSNIDLLYSELPSRVERYAFSPQGPTAILKNKHGDSSGVRGAAWLWPEK